MARDIIITPKNQEPQIQFTGSGDVSSINLNVGSGISPVSGIREAGSGITTLSFEGTQGQLFSITDNLSSGTLFSVADITGLPLLEVDASGAVKISEYGTSTTVGLIDPKYNFDVFGTGGFQGVVSDKFELYASGDALSDGQEKLMIYDNGGTFEIRASGQGGGSINNFKIVSDRAAISSEENYIAIDGQKSGDNLICRLRLNGSNRFKFYNEGFAPEASNKNLGGNSSTARWKSIWGRYLDVDGFNSTTTTLSVGSSAAQSANIAEFKASDNVVIAQVEPDGSIATSGNVSASGNLGIGIASPATKLDIVGTSASDYAPTTVVSITGKTGSGTGWTGTDVESGYTHADGSVDALVTNITPISSRKYLVTFTISGMSAGRFDHIDFGSTRVSVYKTTNGTFTVSFLTESSGTGGGDALELHPRSDFVGTVSIDSIKEVGVRDAVVNTRRSDGTIVNHTRTGPDSESVYIGFEAGESIPEGTPNNTAVGFRALRKNIQGSENTAIGWMALANSFDSWYNTAVGHNIFPYLKNPSNTYNTGMGTNIGISTNFTGSSNVLIGNNILRDATTATANVGLGYNALRNTTTGGYNTALGSNTLFGNTTGSHNVSIGQYASYGMTSGGQNIAMGRFAARYYGESTSVLTTTNNSIFIGSNTKASGDSQTNQIVIGHEAVGNGSNSVTLGANTITKTVLNGDVGINTNSPDAKLHVVAANATDVGVIVKGASAHSASLSEWHASDGVVVARVEPDGSIAIWRGRVCNTAGHC